MSIFISYNSTDETYARTLYNALTNNGFDVWFAPESIKIGENFLSEIGRALSTAEEAKCQAERAEQVDQAQCFILLLSKNSMGSEWVMSELLMAKNRNMPILPLQIDNHKLTPYFEMALGNVQVREAYHMNQSAIQKLIKDLKRIPGIAFDRTHTEERRLTYNEIGIYPIESGDPYFQYGRTLKVTLGEKRFYLSPPEEMLADPAVKAYLKEHTFHSEDEVFSSTLEEECSKILIPDLYEMVEQSRRKIFSQFVNGENGCHFNNEKYGIANISTFERTETLAEEPVLRMEMFLTDYFTHRVMKDVCKQVAVERPYFVRNIDFKQIEDMRILFTSLGVNLILTEENKQILLTSRSTNAAETYNKHQNGLSVIEGVSASDYDPYEKTVNVELTVFRGLKEELGVTDEYILKDSLKFYDLFYNPDNLEMGLSCSIEIRKEYSLQDNILPLRGKDEALELAAKSIVPVSGLKQYIYNNLEAIMPQAVFTLCTYLQTVGIHLLDRMHHTVLKDNTFVVAKDGVSELCGDAYVWSDDYIAVIDGATPKGEMLWDGQRGDIYVSHLVADAIAEMNPELDAEKAILHVNDVVRSAYGKHGVVFEELKPEERLQCCVLIYSKRRHQIWSFGDCMLRINEREITNINEGEQLFSTLRAFCIQIEKDRRGKDANLDELSEYGRERILPYLKEHITLANRNVPFSYDVIDGGDGIKPKHIKVYEVQKGDTVVMASDGYPRLFDTLEETEEYLHEALEEDPICIGKLKGTKGVSEGNESFDDRTYVSFRVE